MPSGIPFNSLRVHTSNLWVSSQLEGSVQIWAKVPDVSIPYGITFNVDTKNPFIFWVSVVESLFSKDKDSDHDGHNSDSSNDDSKKKNSRRIPKKPHWSSNGFVGQWNAAQEAATVLVAIGATRNFTSFMVGNGLDEITEIQQLTRETILLYAKTCRKNLLTSEIVSTRFILDLEKAAFKMTHIKNRVSRVIEPADINKKWCRSMNDQMELEQGCNNEPLKDIYPAQALLSNSTKWMEMLQIFFNMIRDANGVPLAAVIRKQIIPRTDSDDITFVLQY